MTSKPRLIYWDSCVFISYFENDPARIRILETILYNVSKDEKTKIVTSIETKVEVAYIKSELTTRILDLSFEERIEKFWADDSVIEFIEMHEIIADIARGLIRNSIELGIKRVKPKDAIHLASAIWLNVAEFNTYDVDIIDKYQDLTGLSILEPFVDQQLLL